VYPPKDPGVGVKKLKLRTSSKGLFGGFAISSDVSIPPDVSEENVVNGPTLGVSLFILTSAETNWPLPGGALLLITMSPLRVQGEKVVVPQTASVPLKGLKVPETLSVITSARTAPAPPSRLTTSAAVNSTP
jgi:hypothetical protein